MEQLKQMKSMLTSCVQNEITNLKESDYQELGAAVDMIKDLSEAIYYCTITEAMEKKEHEEKYYPMYMPTDYNRDQGRYYGRMYYDGGNSSSSGDSSGSSRSYNDSSNRDSQDSRGRDERGFTDSMYPQLHLDMRDSREGRSPISRRSYMEAKEMHQDKAVKMKELENYVSELAKDITEMIHDASPEEKQMLQKKLAALATKVDA